MKVLTVCGAGSKYTFSGDLRREAASIYEKGRTQGKAVEEIITAITPQLPERDRLEGYRQYLDCVRDLLKKETLENATLSIENWPVGGWDVLVTNPTQHSVAITEAKLVALNPNKGKGKFPYDFAYTLRVMFMGEAARDAILPANKASRMYLALFGRPELCGNWRGLREMLFTPKTDFKDFGKWTCKVELSLVSTLGERGTVSEAFECSRIPVPPPRC